MTNEERNAKVIHLWNTTTLSARKVAAEVGGLTGSAVCGIVHRAKDKITRPKDRRNQPGRQRRVKKETFGLPVQFQFTPKPAVVDQEYCNSMAAAVTSLRSNQCRWPVDDGKTFLFCEAVRDVKSSYCPMHDYHSKRI